MTDMTLIVIFTHFIKEKWVAMKKILILFLLLSGWIISCQKLNPIEPPKEFRAIDEFGSFVDTTITADSAFFVTEPYVLTHAAEKFSVGSYHGFKASFLIHFTRMPNDSNATYDSVYVILYRQHVLGKDAQQLSVNITVPDQEWNDSVNIAPQWHQYQPPAPFETITLNADDSAAVKIAVPTDVFNAWVQDKENNKGLFVSPAGDQSAFIAEFTNFYTSDPELWPKLVYRTKFSEDSVTHDTTNVGIAPTIFDYDIDSPQSVFSLARQNNELIVASGIGSRVFVRFDALKGLPSNSIIYSADLQFEIKNEDFWDPTQENTLNNDDHLDHYYLRMVKAIGQNGSGAVVDSTFKSNTYYNYSIYAGGGKLHFTTEEDQIRFGNGFVQGFLNGKFTSDWFMLHYKNDRNDLSVKRLKSIMEHGVQMRIRYYTVKSEGF